MPGCFIPKKSLTDKARKRLRAIQEFTQLGSGYQLAMRDMEIRGVGNLLGVEQSGQMDAIGFDLYMDMLEEAIAEIRGQEIPKVDDTQVDLKVTAFVPNDYIPDLEQKMSAYRSGLGQQQGGADADYGRPERSLRPHSPCHRATGADAATEAGGQATGLLPH
jgi:transcription-repair coupling factor (superfamily II helicase)